MANTYELTHVAIDLTSGVPVITATGRVKISETGTTSAIGKTQTPAGAILTRTNATVEDVRAALASQYGVTVTLPTP